MRTQLQTVSDALTFIGDWYGVAPSAKQAPQRPGPYPACLDQILAFADQAHPPRQPDRPERSSILTFQDKIYPPDDALLSDGMTLLAAENQGVWAFGYSPDAPDKLYVTGDWLDKAGTRNPESWRSANATTEDALIQVLLTNAFFALCDHCPLEETNTFDTPPAAVNIPLWHHPAWTDWQGFSIDATGNHLHFCGMGLTLTHPKKTLGLSSC